MQYVEYIIAPYVEKVRESYDTDTPALVIMDNFKGQVTESFTALLDTHNIHVCLLPANTTDRLQTMDTSVNKPAKDFLKRQFDQWYSEQVLAQQDTSDLNALELQPVNLGLPALKELGVKWLVDMATYISNNPQMIVNGFIHSRITATVDGQDIEDTEDQDQDLEDQDSEDDFDESEADVSDSQ